MHFNITQLGRQKQPKHETFPPPPFHPSSLPPPPPKKEPYPKRQDRNQDRNRYPDSVGTQFYRNREKPTATCSSLRTMYVVTYIGSYAYLFVCTHNTILDYSPKLPLHTYVLSYVHAPFPLFYCCDSRACLSSEYSLHTCARPGWALMPSPRAAHISHGNKSEQSGMKG